MSENKTGEWQKSKKGEWKKEWTTTKKERMKIRVKKSEWQTVFDSPILPFGENEKKELKQKRRNEKSNWQQEYKQKERMTISCSFCHWKEQKQRRQITKRANKKR